MRKATLRRSGKHMVTVSVTHHLEAHDVARLLITRTYGGCPEAMTRAEAEKAIREQLGYRGMDGLTDWSENLDETEVEGQRSWARLVMGRYFPELLPELPEDF